MGSAHLHIFFTFFSGHFCTTSFGYSIYYAIRFLSFVLAYIAYIELEIQL